jgi:hypothetical protein
MKKQYRLIIAAISGLIAAFISPALFIIPPLAILHIHILIVAEKITKMFGGTVPYISLTNAPLFFSILALLMFAQWFGIAYWITGRFNRNEKPENS